MSTTIKIDDDTAGLLEEQARAAGLTFKRSGKANLSGYVRKLAYEIKADKLGLIMDWLEAPEDGERVPVVMVEKR